MSSRALTYPSLRRRRARRRARAPRRPRRRGFFWASPTQHVRSHGVAREVTRAAVALSALVAWGTLLVLLFE
jgi:hypothetical protein